MRRTIHLFLILFSSLQVFSQNVGIGTSVPSAKLEIESDGSPASPQLHLYEDANDYARLKFNNTNTSNFWTIGGYTSNVFRNDVLLFSNDDGGDLMVLQGNGCLGLGVGISPKTDFHVAEDSRVLFGADTIGHGDKLMFLPNLHAFRVGSLNSGAASTYWNRDSIGLYSFASGLNTRAQGYTATAMGGDTEATNSYAFATGFFSNADGAYSTAMGFNTDAFGQSSVALGHSADAEEKYTIAVGYFAEAQAEKSIALGSHTHAQSLNSTAIGSYNVGGGSATQWNDDDPILEIGIGQSEGTRNNALTVLKDGKHGIMTTAPTANLHVKNDGVAGSGTIVAVIESSVSDRPILQFSETPLGDAASGMSIEYNGSGSGSDNKMHFNDVAGAPVVTFESGGQVGINTTTPAANLHVKNDGVAGARTIVAVLESNISDRPTLLFSEFPTSSINNGMSIEYDGSSGGSDDKMHINKSGGEPAFTVENGGQVGIGVPSPTFALHLKNSTSTGVARAQAWTTYSDERIKENEQTLSYGLTEILLLKPLSYKQYDASFENSEVQLSPEYSNTIGFFAQEVFEIIPEAVVKPENEDEQLWGMDYEKLIPVLVKAMQEQQIEIEQLKEEIKKMEVQMNTTSQTVNN